MQNAIEQAVQQILQAASAKQPIPENEYALLKRQFEEQLMQTIGMTALTKIPESKQPELIKKMSEENETELTVLFGEYIPDIETFIQTEINNYTDEIIKNFE